MSDYADILYAVEDPVAVITLNRPDSMNGWTGRMDAELRDAVARANADRSVVGIVLTGAGRAFCAGADMNNLQSLSAAGAQAPREQGPSAPWTEPSGEFGGRFTYLLTTDKPVIAAVNGACAGMAFPLALCCDLRVVTPKSLFLTAFAQRGLIAEWGLSFLLPRLVGPGVAMDLLLSSRRVGGEEAFRLGIANYLVEPEDLLSFCREYVMGLAERCSPASMAVMKRQVYEQLHVGLGAAEFGSQALMAESFARGDFAEGVKSFVEKRSPAFPRLGS
jgi:enoyl-CoA hydratase/carnithine racemase